MSHDELRATPAWHRTGSVSFPTAALVEGEWWVLRINCFPDHPLWTLFVGGQRRFDLDDTPATWGRPSSRLLPSLTAGAAASALEPIVAFVAYGSEVGQPCDNPFCCG